VIVEELLTSGNAQDRELGLSALRSVLEATYFSSIYAFEFGSQSRDYGYWPSTNADVAHWFKSALSLVERIFNAKMESAPQVATVLADKFKSLWCSARRYNELEKLSQIVAKDGFWREGWIQVHRTLGQEGQNMPVDVHNRLKELEKSLRPKDLIERVKAVVLSRQARGLYVEDFDDEGETQDGLSAYGRADNLAEKLGEELAADGASLDALSAELVSGSGRQSKLGEGLARGTNPNAIWNTLVAELSIIPPGIRNVQVFFGMLFALRDHDPQLAERLLDEAVEDEPLAEWLPLLQTAVPINDAGVRRLKRSLAIGKAPIERFSNLAGGGATAPVPGGDMKELVLQIAEKPNGLRVAIDVLSMRLHVDASKKRAHHKAVCEAGRLLLGMTVPGEEDERRDWVLGEIAKGCLVGHKGKQAALNLCRKLRIAVATNQTQGYYHKELIGDSAISSG
jgi:hypothetical protein